MRDRLFDVDATLGRYYSLSFPEREDGTTLSPLVGFVRQFESAMINEVGERCGLIPKRVGAGAEQSRNFLAVNSAVDQLKRSAERDAALGVPMSAFMGAFSQVLEGRRRELQGKADLSKAQVVADQLRVQSAAARMVDPATGAVPPVQAIRVPQADGSVRTYGFAWKGKIKRDLELWDGKQFLAPVEAGLDELEMERGVIRGAAVQSLLDRGVEFISRQAHERDLLGGTPLEQQDGSRVLLAGLLSESLDVIVEDGALEKPLKSVPVSGTAEFLRRADQQNAAILVTCQRLDHSTREDLNRAKDGAFVDPVAQLVDSVRDSIIPMAHQESFAELAKEVKGEIAQMAEGRRFKDAEPIDRIRKNLVFEMRKIEKNGGDVFESVAKVMSLALDRADERRSRQSREQSFGGDLAIIVNRSTSLQGALGDVRSVMREIGLDEKRLAAFKLDQVFRPNLDEMAGISRENSVLGRQFRKTWTLMTILTHGNVKVGAEGAGEVDPYAGDNQLYPLANAVMANVGGIVQRQYSLAMAEGMMADAFLVEAHGTYLDSLHEGAGAAPNEIAGLQIVARTALADAMQKGVSEMPPEYQAWYKQIRDQIEALGIPVNEKSFQTVVERMRNPRAKALLQRAVLCQSLLGTHYGAMKAEARVPGHPVRLGKISAGIRIAQDVASRIPDVPHYPSNPTGVVRLFHAQDEEGNPSGRYGKLLGKPNAMGRMDWSFEGILDRPRVALPTETHLAALARQRVEILHASVPLPFPAGIKGEPTPAELRTLITTVCNRFSDVPLNSGGYLGHATIDGGEHLAELGIHLPSGAGRVMNLSSGRNVVHTDFEKSLPMAELDLIPLNTQTGELQRRRDGTLEYPKRMGFTTPEDLKAELERRIKAAVGEGGLDTERGRELRGVADAVARHCERLMNVRAQEGPVLAIYTGASGQQRPCALLAVPIKGRRKSDVRLVEDPEACTQAYAAVSQSLASMRVSLEGIETRV